MDDDIVTRLRAEADAHADGDWNDQVIRCRFTEAADEIQRLREERDTARAEASIKGYRLDDALDEIERLRAQVRSLEELGDALAVVAHHDTQGWSQGHKAWKPLKAWQEARRG